MPRKSFKMPAAQKAKIKAALTKRWDTTKTEEMQERRTRRSKYIYILKDGKMQRMRLQKVYIYLPT